MAHSAEGRPDSSNLGLAAAIDGELFESIGIGVFVIDQGGVVRALNPKAASLLGWSAQECEGLPAHETFHLARYSADECPILAVARTGVPHDEEADLFRRSDSSLMPVWWTATPIHASGKLEHGATVGAVVAFADTTARHAGTVSEKAAHAQVRSDLGTARQAVSDLGWAAQVTHALASAPDEVEALTRLARMAVPRLCDVVVVHRVDETGLRERVSVEASGHLRAAVHKALDAPVARAGHVDIDPPDPESAHIVVFGDRQEAAASGLVDPQTQAVLEAVEAECVMIVPMVARGHLVAVAEMVNTTGSAPFEEHDRFAAMDLARRVGLAVDNLRLLQAERNTVVVLQEALLPTLSNRPGLRLAWRYLPARDLHLVGGDWYDAFACPGDPGVTVLVVGDVAGHDLAAATNMAAIRNLLRGIAVTLPLDPARLLAAVDDHLDDLAITATATAVVATVRRQPEPGRGSASVWRLRWSNAGHLPPILVRPDGKVERLDTPPDPLLGSGGTIERAFHTQYLAPGSTLVLYTDGLVEFAGENLEVGLDRLVGSLGHAGTARSPELTLATILRQVPRSLEDDTAIVVVALD